MNALKTLTDFFPTGTTEGERHILRKAFVQTDEFAEIFTPPPHSPRLLVGKKGSGKSALFEFALRLYKKAEIPALLLKPMDIEYDSFSDESGVGELTKAAYTALLRAVAMKLGSEVGALVSGPDKALYEEAITAGIRERDAVEKIASILPNLAKPYSNIDLSALLPGHTSSTYTQLQNAISKNLAQSGRGFYLFVDDTDQLAAPGKSGHLNRIWAFILAARELSNRVQQLRCIVSLREEIWRRLTRDRAGQRDQTDHFTDLVRHLNPNREHILRIVQRRLDLAADELGARQTTSWNLFFEGEKPRMPSTEIRTSWQDLIIVRSRERPRDAIQMINECARRAIKSDSEKITDEIFAAEMRFFSKVRADLLCQEVEFECPNLEQIIRSFASLEYDYSSFKATAEAIRKHLRSLGTSFPVIMFGQPLKVDRDEGLFELWRFLYDIGLLNARIADEREKDGFRHVFPIDDPTLVGKPRWNEMQAIVWEIGPAYRDHLIRIQEEKNAQLGLPPKGRRRKRR